MKPQMAGREAVPREWVRVGRKLDEDPGRRGE